MIQTFIVPHPFTRSDVIRAVRRNGIRSIIPGEPLQRDITARVILAGGKTGVVSQDALWGQIRDALVEMEIIDPSLDCSYEFRYSSSINALKSEIVIEVEELA